MSAFSNLCHRDADTGEYFCARIGGWVEKCPNFPDGYPWDPRGKQGKMTTKTKTAGGLDNPCMLRSIVLII